METFVCVDCAFTYPVSTFGSAGYAVTPQGFLCYGCCAVRDKASMAETGKATLYLVAVSGPRPFEVTNWPGTLRLPVSFTRRGRHNIARTRLDVWFNGPDGAEWHGVRYGENTEILRCNRVRH